MLTVSVHPNTLDEVQSAIDRWLGEVSKGNRPPASFARIAKSSKGLCFSSKPTSDFRIELKHGCALIRVKNRRLSVNLENFLVSTAFDGERLCLNIERDPKEEHRFLNSALRQAAETKHPAFVSRVLRVVRNLEEDLPATKIDEATAAPTDYEVIVDALSASPAVVQSISDDPLAAAKLRGLKRKQQLIEQGGGTLTSEQVAEVLGITRQAVDKRRASGQLLALTQGKRGYSYPGFQFEEGKTVKGLEEALKQLNGLDPWMQLVFFGSPNDRLDGKTPIEVLRTGDSGDVVRAAEGYGEQGAA